MKDLRTLMVTDELQAAARRLASRLDGIQIDSANRWRSVAEQCFAGQRFVDLATADSGFNSTAVLVGPPAFVLKHAAATSSNFGFVMAVAQTGRRWPRTANWRDDATLDLWRAGWSPRAIDRILVPTGATVIEFVIGDVCPTPHIAGQSTES